MCGLCGEIRFDGEPVDLSAVRAMTDAMAPRGPDGSGVHARSHFGLGHRRLSIIDLSARGAQPMVDSQLGLSWVFNGCIYNHQDIRDQLEKAGYRFFSEADSEVVGKAYHYWGLDFVDHLRGMFAIAIAETDTGRVVLARDRFGIKPLYLSEGPGRLRFASSVQALLAAGDVDTSLDRVALHHYFTFHAVVPAPRTVFNGIRKLPPATVRRYEPNGAVTERRYWNPPYARDPEKDGWSAQEWQEALLDSFREAVKLRMVSDVPVGVLLSGGFDSSLVVALLAASGQHGLKTFSIGFDAASGESGDEYAYSDLVAETFATDHHKIHIDTSRLYPAVLPSIRAMSEPMVSHDCVAFYLLSEEVSKHVKVVQSGQGADEVLAGYGWYPPLEDVPLADATQAYSKVFFDRDHDRVNSLLEQQFGLAYDPSWAYAREHLSAAGAETSVDAALRLDSQTMLVEDPVKRVDNMTMAWGLEARVPFIDHKFAELAALCPPELKLSGGGKGVLKDASRGVLPDAILDRTKGHFPVPGIRHLEGELLDLVHDALDGQVARNRGLYRREALETLYADPNRYRTPMDANTLWQVATLELWLQELGR
ncbi:MAG: N-acetylglutaminylglutamine amidotransferase [Propionibacteriaceae bacterium]|nr:N-acetylglutaminylglutamine amidotransferase [Propionibacteriaceae bacterium]